MMNRSCLFHSYSNSSEGVCLSRTHVIYQNGRWIASVELRGIEPQTFYGTTQAEVQAQMLEYLDQIVQELERTHASLHAILGNPPEYQKENQ